VSNTNVSYRRLDLFALANKIWQMRKDVSQPQLSIVVSKNLAWENGQAGSFIVTRTGELSGNLSFNYRLAGMATNGVDYQLLGGTGTFAAGQSTAQISVMAIDDAVAESGETVKISLAMGNGYQLTNNHGATLAIVDNDSVLYGSASVESSRFINSSSFSASDNLVLFSAAPVVTKLATTVVKTLPLIVSSIELGSMVQTLSNSVETIAVEIFWAVQYSIEDADLLVSGLLTKL
jgi:hypothetical protein